MGKHALLVGVGSYEDRSLSPLPAVRADLDCLKQVLEEPRIGGFEVETVAEPNAHTMQAAIGVFLDARTPDDLVLLYVSGHGIWCLDEGQLYFAAGDTDQALLTATGVSATYVTETLEQCRARRKIVLLDCCFSGAFVQGLRARGTSHGTGDPPLPSDPVTPHGVYVITASDQRQHAYEGLPLDGVAQPSLFTGAVVEGLRTGNADVRRHGAITPDDLWTYVGEQVRRQRADQSPTKSMVGVNHEIEIAKSIKGERAFPLRPLAPAGHRLDSEEVGEAPERSVDAPVSATRLASGDWGRLLDYYHDCLAAEAANETFLPLDQEGSARVALWTGADDILVGDRASVRVPPGTDAEALVGRAHRESRTLAYGYPAVLLFDRKNDGKLAPLFTRLVEPRPSVDGWELRPVGPVMLHPGLIKRQMAPTDAQVALAEFEPGWSAGSHSDLARDARTWLEELRLSAEPLRPTDLRFELGVPHPGPAGRNAALLYEADEASRATQGLMNELKKLRDTSAGFAETALAPFAGAPGSADELDVRPFEVATPLDLNEAQEAVLRSAMTRRLTVATGPPGTGKSQLVANVVATAVASGQRVLVTSTNNRAVDVVVDHCERLAPGLLLRTGSRTYEQAEIDCLRGLQSAQRPARKPDKHVLRLRAEDRDEARERCARKAEVEARLLELSLQRREIASALGLVLTDLPSSLAQDSGLKSMRRLAGWAKHDPILGRWHRRRLAAALGLPDAGKQTCSDATRLLDIEVKWRRQRAEAERLPPDATLADELRASASKWGAASRDVVAATAGANVHEAQPGIAQRLQALQGTGSTWSAFNAMRDHLGAWAVTTHSAGRLPLDAKWFDLVIVDEASQCSIPAVLPMLYRAKRALIIGDPMQLTHITTCNAAQSGDCRRRAELGAALLEQLQLDYVRHSAFRAASAARGEPPLMLDEHFRCHPEIIAGPNRLFYGERLTILTDPRRLARIGSDTRLRWVDVTGSPEPGSGGSWCNRAEVDRVCEEITRLRDLLPDDATIGVVTPFAAQKRAIMARVGDAARVGTAHAFQGDERDAIVLSLVGGPGMHKRSLSWLDRSASLWNVAITRARAHLVIVGDRDFWRSRTGILGDLARGAAADRSSLDPWGTGSDVAADTLHRILERRVPNAFERDAAIDGYACDFRIGSRARGDDPADSLAVILDRGANGTEPARHLRLQLERCELLRRAGMAGAERVPAWRALAEPDDVVSALVAGFERPASSK